MCSSEFPFSDLEDRLAGAFEWPETAEFSAALKELLAMMLEPRAEFRLTIEQIRRSEWTSGGHFTPTSQRRKVCPWCGLFGFVSFATKGSVKSTAIESGMNEVVDWRYDLLWKLEDGEKVWMFGFFLKRCWPKTKCTDFRLNLSFCPF